MIKCKKAFYIILGTIALVCGWIGIFVPGVPVTPFILLSLWSYSRGWISMYNKLGNNKFVNKYINTKGTTLRSKIVTMILMVSMVIFSVYIHWEDKILPYVLISLGVIGFVCMMKYIKVEELVVPDKHLEEGEDISDKRTECK